MKKFLIVLLAVMVLPFAHAEEAAHDTPLLEIHQMQLGYADGYFLRCGDIEIMIDGVSRKMIRRHPHIFGDAVADTPEASLVLWKQIKAQEKAEKAARQAAKKT